MHALCSFIITFIFGLFNIVAGILVGLTVGVSKEVYDKIKGSKFDSEDLVWDLVGISIAATILVIL